MARTLGADVTIDVSKEKLAAILPGIKSDDAVDVAIESSGNAGALNDALSCVITGGRLVLAGLPGRPVPIDLTGHVILREITIHGLYGRLIDETWLQAERLMTSGDFDLRPLITHVFPLADYKSAFRQAISGDCGKVLFYMGD